MGSEDKTKQEPHLGPCPLEKMLDSNHKASVTHSGSPPIYVLAVVSTKATSDFNDVSLTVKRHVVVRKQIHTDATVNIEKDEWW